MKSKILKSLFVFLLSAGGVSVCLGAEEPDLPGASQPEVIEKDVVERADEKMFAVPKLAPDIETYEEPLVEEAPAVLFTAKKIILEGDAGVISQEKTNPILAEYENRPIGLNDLNQLTKRLEALYLQEGFLVLAFVPPQKIESDQVRIKVILAKMGEIHLEGSRFYRDWRTRWYWKIPKGKILRYDEIRSNILDMNENPDRRVKAVLRPGKDPETTDVVLTVEDHFPAHAGFSVDNQGSPLTGKIRPGFNFQHNNLLGFDDTLLMGTVFGEEFGVFYAQYAVPITNRGTKLVGKYSTSQVSPKKEFAETGVNGISQTHGVELKQRILRTQSAFGELSAGFDWKEKRTRALSQVVVEEHLRVLSAGALFQTFDPQGIWVFKPDVSFGLDFDEDDILLTSRDAGSSFSKGNIFLRRSQILPWQAQAEVTLRAQVSPDKLSSAEQIFLGGADSIRGYPESDYGADQAVVVNVEYTGILFFVSPTWTLPMTKKPLREKVQWTAFFDYGHGRLHAPSETEHRSRELFGAGAGLKIQMADNAALKLEWGFPLGDESLSESGDSQFYFNFQASF
jgi:hemolysin activation/secretion protein